MSFWSRTRRYAHLRSDSSPSGYLRQEAIEPELVSSPIKPAYFGSRVIG